jgi:D-alanine-D-alanine ligase
MRIGLTYDLRSEYLAMGYSEEETAEFDRDDTIASIETALAACGYETVRIGHLRSLVARLAAGERWELVFNVAEGMCGYSREAQVPALLEAYNIPFTGSDALTLALTHHKGYTKEIVARAGVPTPAFALICAESDIDAVDLPFPLFVKPVAEGTGKGVTGKSRVTTPAQLREQCCYVLENFHQPALVETYLPGREITVGVLGTGSAARVIGALEIEALDGAEANAYSYYNKENCEEVIRYTKLTDSAMLASAEKICLAAWRALGGRDTCRMDLRADDRGALSFIEVNALPGLHPQHSDLPMICDRIGMPYSDLIGSIVASARERYGI